MKKIFYFIASAFVVIMLCTGAFSCSNEDEPWCEEEYPSLAHKRIKKGMEAPTNHTDYVVDRKTLEAEVDMHPMQILPDIENDINIDINIDSIKSAEDWDEYFADVFEFLQDGYGMDIASLFDLSETAFTVRVSFCVLTYHSGRIEVVINECYYPDNLGELYSIQYLRPGNFVVYGAIDGVSDEYYPCFGYIVKYE